MSAADELRALREELAQLRERVAVLESRTAPTIVLGQRLNPADLRIGDPQAPSLSAGIINAMWQNAQVSTGRAGE
ncbi:MAG: hypothetical protein JSS14_21965 [Proteobacteria bacterium]|nr:hypothetical protein [Pseudomonadota bacterium]